MITRYEGAQHEMRNMPLGRTVRILAPIVADRTEHWKAGVLTFAVEYRELRTAIDREVWNEATDEAYEDRGVTVHVLDTETGREYLRFDCFDNDPHYHYNWPGCGEDVNEVVVFDPHANGEDMLTWTLQALRKRLAAMLANSGGAHLVDQLDSRRIERVLNRVEVSARSKPLTTGAAG